MVCCLMFLMAWTVHTPTKHLVEVPHPPSLAQAPCGNVHNLDPVPQQQVVPAALVEQAGPQSHRDKHAPGLLPRLLPQVPFVQGLPSLTHPLEQVPRLVACAQQGARVWDRWTGPAWGQLSGSSKGARNQLLAGLS